MIQQLPVSSYKSEDHLSQADMTLPQSELPERLTKDESCQVGNVLNDPFKDLTSLQENLEIADIDIKNQTGKQVVHNREQASSEEAVEHDTVKTSFSNIVSSACIKTLLICKDEMITHYHFFSSGRALLCKNNKTLMILDHELNVIPFISSTDDINDIATFDKETVVIAFNSSDVSRLNFISVGVIAALQIGKNIQLKILCNKMACFNKTFYVFSNDLKTSPSFECKGVQIISKNGDILKNIQLLDYLKDFSINAYGNIKYVSETTYFDGSIEQSFKCVTSKGDVVSCSLIVKKYWDYSWRVYDDDGNSIGFNISDKQIEVVKLDGTVKPILVKQQQGERISAMFYDKYSNTLLVQFNMYKKVTVHNREFYHNRHASRKLLLYRLK